jgi:hypothetical protein
VALGHMQAHPCANFLHDPAFQRAVLVGAGAGALGFAAGFLVVAFAPAGGLGTAIIVGAISGGVGGGVEEFAQQSLSGESINSQTIGATMLSGVVSGGVFAGVGYGVGRVARGAIRSSLATSYENMASHEIGDAGEEIVLRNLNDPTAQRKVPIRVVGVSRPNGRFDIVTSSAIHEVKNVAKLSLSQRFKNQALFYKAVADAAETPLVYHLLRDVPPHVVRWLERQGIQVMIGR